jgi:hypothetical protein
MTKKTRFVLLMSLVSIAGSCYSVTLYVVPNGSFETPIASDGGVSSPTTEWALDGGFAVGAFDPIDSNYPGSTGTGVPSPADGNQVAYINASPTFTMTSSTITALAPDLDYTLTLAVGARSDVSFGGYSVELLVGGTSVASVTDASGPIPIPGTFTLLSLDYSSPAAGSPLIGQDITVLLRGGDFGTQTNFDALSFSSVPELSYTSFIFGFATLSFIMLRRRLVFRMGRTYQEKI